MILTKQWFKEQSACEDGYKWVVGYFKFKKTKSIKAEILIADLINWNNLCEQNQLKNQVANYNLNWANWTICRVLNSRQKIQYAIFAAEQVIDIFEKKYPEDKRPRQAIEASIEYLKNPTKENANTASAAASAADAADAAYAAYAAAYAAADAAAKAAQVRMISELGNPFK